MIEKKASASNDLAFKEYSTTENDHGVYTPDVDDHPLTPPIAAHLPNHEKHTHQSKHAASRSHRPSSSRQHLQDPEKRSYEQQSVRSQPVHATPYQPTASTHSDDDYEDEEEDEDDAKRHAVWILVRLMSESVKAAFTHVYPS